MIKLINKIQIEILFNKIINLMEQENLKSHLLLKKVKNLIKKFSQVKIMKRRPLLFHLKNAFKLNKIQIISIEKFILNFKRKFPKYK
jgi:hypothetical protein